MKLLPLIIAAGLAVAFMPASGLTQEAAAGAQDAAETPVSPALRQSPAQNPAQAGKPGQRAVSVPQLRQMANKAYADKNYPAFLQIASALHEMRPWNSDYMALLVTAYALNENRDRAYEMMLTMQRQGLTHDFNSTDDTTYLRGTEAYDHINDLMIRAGEPAGLAEEQFKLPESLRLASAMVWDETREAFLVGDIASGAVYSAKPDGTTELLLKADEENGLWGVFGLEVDAANNRLWVSSSATRNFSGLKETDNGRSGLFEFSLDKLELQAKYPVPADGRPHRLGDIVQVKNGDIYAIDTILPVIYRLEKGGDRLVRFVASMDNVYLRNIAASDDGRFLYFADYELGITVLDLQDRKAVRLTGPETLNFGGIEGLEYWNGHLVIVQNGISPQRVMRLKLSADGGSIDEVAPLAIAQPFFDHPSFGALHEGQLWFFANSYGAHNVTRPQPVRVAVTPVAEAASLVSPDVEKFWDEYYEKTGQERPSGS